MKYSMRKCSNCGRYTLNREYCPVCGSVVVSPHPPKFSLDDPYWKYRVNKRLYEKLGESVS